MARRMLIDASAPGETRVALVDGNQLIDYDFEDASKRQVKSSIFLAQVTRVEPSLQAAFLEYGSLKQGFLALPEIHPDYYKIPVADRDQLNAALKQSAAEVQAEIDHMVEDEGVRAAIAEESAVDNAVAPEAVPLLSSFGRGELIAALSEFIGPPAPEAYVPVQSLHGALITPTQTAEETEQDDDEDSETDESEGRNRGGWHGRNRGGYRGRREQMDPEAMEAARRRQLLRSYKIQEVIKRRQVMLVQVNKEERGTKGAALTTYISLPGRYCVLMPNSSNAGGVSRKITNPADRRRMKELMSGLQLPEGMGVILRTAGLECTPDEIARDLDYLLRLWDNIRELTMKSTAPALIYEEGDLITRAIRDLYSDDISEIVVSGQSGYEAARAFMNMLLPQHLDQIKLHDGRVPLFARYNVDDQIDAVHEPVVQLPSGGYIVINQTEALVAIDVNSGRATRERNIEETAYRTNLEAATEVARQLRLRDLAGLIVVDFIDMEDHRHRIGVERRMRDAMKVDRARTQVGRISTFGLLELSRQRLRPSLMEAHFARCETCAGTGWVRSTASAARHVLRAIEQELAKGSLERLTVFTHSKLALQLLNQFRMQVIEIEERTKTNIVIDTDDSLTPPNYRLDKMRGSRAGAQQLSGPMVRDDVVNMRSTLDTMDAAEGENSFNASRAPESSDAFPPESSSNPSGAYGQQNGRRRYRGRGSNQDASREQNESQPPSPAQSFNGGADDFSPTAPSESEGETRGRSRRGGRGRGRGRGGYGYNDAPASVAIAGAEQPSVAPDAFTHPKQQYWGANASAPTAQQQPASETRFESRPTGAPAPTTKGAAATTSPPSSAPPLVHTSPVVTRLTPTGEESSAEGDGSSRKGWWNKLMGT